MAPALCKCTSRCEAKPGTQLTRLGLVGGDLLLALRSAPGLLLAAAALELAAGAGWARKQPDEAHDNKASGTARGGGGAGAGSLD